MRRYVPVALALFAVVFYSIAPSAAQQRADDRFEIVVRGVPLSEALESLVRLTQIDLVYNSDLVAGVEVFCVRSDATAEALLQCVLADSGLEYVRSLSGAYVLIPAVRRAPAEGSLAGLVVDAETGAPLPFANVFLAEAATGTAANEAGLFAVAPLISGPYSLTVTYVGYRTVVDSVYITPGGRHRVRVPMHSAAAALSPVVIDGLEQRLPSQGLGSERLGAADLARSTALGTVDVARAAATLPGVSVQRPLADLHIQGGSAGSHVVLLDGAPVRDPVSLGRHLSAFSPLALGRMTVQRAGFSAAEGSNLTGQLVVEHDLSVEGPAEMRVTIDPVSLNARIGARLGDRNPIRGSAMLAIRSSVWDVYREPYVDELFRTWHAADPLITSYWLREPVTPQSVHVISQVPDVRFSDLHAAMRLRPSSFQTVEASVYRARNQLGSRMAAVNAVDVSNPTTLFATDDLYDWTNWAAQVRHNWLLGARTLVSSHLRGSWHDSRYTYGTGLAPASPLGSDELQARAAELLSGAPAHVLSDESNRIVETMLGADVRHSITSKSGVSAGISAAHVSSRFRLGSPFIAPFAYDIESWHVGGYLEADIHAGVGTVINPGLRTTYVPARDATFFEPRLAIRHDRSHTAIGGLAMRLSGGIYRQFVNEFELTSSGSTSVVPFVFFWLPVGASVAPPRAYHLAGDLMVMPTTQWTMNLSLYHKWQPRLLVLDYDELVTSAPPGEDERRAWLRQDGFVAEASGRAFGGDVRVRYDSDRWSVSGGYAMSIARRTIPNRFGGQSHSVSWNVPHQFHGTTRVDLLPDLNVEVNAHAAAGRTWAYRDSYYDYLLQRVDPSDLAPIELGDPMGQQLPVALTLDAGVTYRLSWRHASAQVRLFVLNVLDRDNLYERNAFGPTGSLQSFGRSLPGRSFLLSLSFQR